MKATPSFRSLTLYYCSLAALFPTTFSIPLTYSISQGGKECLFERLDANEHLTVSVFISSGAQLRGSIAVEGPVSPLHDDKGNEEPKAIKADIDMYERGTRFAKHIIHGSVPIQTNQDLEISFYDKLDFEKILGNERPDYDDFLEDENDEYPRMYHQIVGDDDMITPEEKVGRLTRFEAYKKKMKEKDEKKRPPKRVQSLLAESGIVREGEPWQRTFQAKAPGYYRACISSAWHPVSTNKVHVT